MEQIIKNTAVKHGLSAAVSFCLVIGIFRFQHLYMPYSILMLVLAVLGMMLIIETALPIMTKRSNIASVCFSAVLSATMVISRKINIFGEPYYLTYTRQDILYWILIGIALFFLIQDLLFLVQKYTVTCSSDSLLGKRLWLLVFAAFVVCWIPYFIIFYPGNLSPDSFSSVHQSIGTTPLNNHHPILFTFFVNICIQVGLLFGDLNVAVAFFSVTQLFLVAALLSYSVYWLARKKLPKYVIVFCILFFALNPVVAMYSFTMWKDILFSVWMLLLMMFLFDIVESNGELLRQPKSLVLFSLLCGLVAFGRNNGVFVVVAILVVLGIYVRCYWKVLLPVFVSVVVLIAAIQGPVYSALNIGQSEFAESVGIPLQQIGYTLKSNGKVTEEQKEFLNQIMPIEKIKEVYQAHSPDHIKFNAAFDNQFLEENKVEFIKIWAQMLVPNFKWYVKAYLMQTIGYWHIGTTNWICMFGVDENTDGINNLGYPTMQKTIEKQIDKIPRYPLVRNLFSIGFMVWLVVFYCTAMIVKRRTKYLIPVLPLIVLWGTLMIAAPTYCEFRYMFAFHLALPFLFVTLFIIKQKTATDDLKNKQN